MKIIYRHLCQKFSNLYKQTDEVSSDILGVRSRMLYLISDTDIDVPLGLVSRSLYGKEVEGAIEGEVTGERKTSRER